MSSLSAEKTARPRKPWTLKGVLIRLVIYLTVVPYAALLIVAIFFSNAILFPAPAPSYSDEAGILKLKDAQGTSISAVYLPNESASFTILYSHGNAEDIGEIMPELRHLQNLGFAVFAYDYPGYGTSRGEPSEAGVYRAIDAAFTRLTEDLHVPAEKIVVMGRSLGGGPSVDLAVRQKVGGLILQSAFVSAFRVLTVWPILPFDKFNNVAKIGKVQCPVLVIHGTLDEVVGFHNGKTLFESAPEPKQFAPITGAHHNDVPQVGGKTYDKAIVDFINGLGVGT